MSQTVPAGADARLPMTTKAGFAVGQIAGQLFRDAPSLLLLFYLANLMGIDPAIAGAAIFVPKVFFGAVFDLSVGISSDKHANRFPRRNWLLIGAIAAPAAMIGPFLLPEQGSLLQTIWVFAAFSFYMAIFSTFSVPFLAQFAEMTDNPAERTELMAWKHAYGGAGLLAGSAGTPVLIHLLGGDRMAYIWSISLIGVICSISLLISWYYAGRIPERQNHARPITLRELPRVFADRNFVVLCLTAIIMTLAAGTAYASYAFFVTYAMDRSDAFVQIGIMTTIMGFVVMAGSPIWVWVAKQLGKKRTYVLAAGSHGALLFVWGSFPDGPIWTAYIFSALLALFNTGWGLIVLSLLSDVIARSREERGENRGGAYSAVWSIIEKAGIAAGGSLIVGSLLSFTGFDAELAKQGIAQSQDAIDGIVLTYAFIPGAAKICAAIIIWLFLPMDSVTPPQVKEPLHA